MKRVLREFLIGPLQAPLPWPRVAIYAAILLVFLALTKTSLFPYSVPTLNDDGHSIYSLSLAVNRTVCGVPSGLSTDDQIGKLLFRDISAHDQPVRAVISAHWGSVDRYCATVTRPYVNNENSLMLLESWAWRIAPNLSLSALGRVLLGVKLALLVFFGIAALRLGVGVVVCYAMVDVGFALLGRLQPDLGYSTYSFLECMVIATVALYPLMLSLRAESRARQLAWPAIAGTWTAFVVNMRTSYLPLCAAAGLMYVCAILLRQNDSDSGIFQRCRRTAIAVLCFALGYSAFQYTFITQSRGAGTDLSYHTVFHPLVLSVGIPTSAFSEREGIQWDDAVGLTLAHRVDPSAQYLSKEYERALATYYISLWKRYPSEMFHLYLEKAKLAGTEMIALDDVTDGALMAARRVLRLLPNGILLLTLLSAFAIVSAGQYLKRRMPVAMLFALIGTVATLLTIESMLIVPRYFLKYHAPLLLLCCSVTFIVVQAGLSRMVRRMTFARDPRVSSSLDGAY